ncbi:uncharacterized protein NPIL_382271 [Nephila pilipes]|uniref:Uncharacterized protein n=1 Tax=Nephila pilipes TaxID=299642 RepID=A0A8X6QEU4_NEPPI|nr:uncharacterized protein NPIL_382271 [Nephila pilipes]
MVQFGASDSTGSTKKITEKEKVGQKSKKFLHNFSPQSQQAEHEKTYIRFSELSNNHNNFTRLSTTPTPFVAMETANICIFLVILAILCDIVCSGEFGGSSTHLTEHSFRSGPKNSNVIYTPVNDNKINFKLSSNGKDVNLQQSKSASPSGKEPGSKEKASSSPSSFNYNNYIKFPKSNFQNSSPKDNMQESGTNVDWNVWDGDEPNSAELKPPKVNIKGAPPQQNFDYYYPVDSWKDNPWDPEKMAAIMVMMKELQKEKEKPSSLLSSLKKDPATFLLVTAIPISILLAAILPTLMKNMISNGQSTITTTATGSRARQLIEQNLMYPFLEGISAFGERVLENPSCVQRIFCEVTKGDTKDSSLLQKALYTASSFINDDYLENYGVKNLFDSMADGNCDNIPCANLNFTDYVMKLLHKESKD